MRLVGEVVSSESRNEEVSEFYILKMISSNWFRKFLVNSEKNVYLKEILAVAADVQWLGNVSVSCNMETWMI